MKSINTLEERFSEESHAAVKGTNVKCIVVENFPKLGLLTALSFLNWASDNPEGVVSLPTGKTPEYFIKWLEYLLSNWDEKRAKEIRDQYCPDLQRKPELSGLHFVQIDEFYPIDPVQKNSFYNYVRKFYIQDLGLDPAKALFINCREIPLVDGRSFEDVFPDLKVDLSLRFRECATDQEKLQQQSIFAIDEWCSDYERRIRSLGGIGFFLGGIGPDGHIAFNVRGSDFHSTTRLTETNFETQAAAASDLGGIEISRNRLVITIGLSTITANPDCKAIIIAAGEAKANIVRKSLEKKPSNTYPASALSKLPQSRFYLTTGAARKLTDRVKQWYKDGDWTQEKTQRSVIELCRKANTFGPKLKMAQLEADPHTGLIPDLDENTVKTVIRQIEGKLYRSLTKLEDQVFLHTGPHHDDIMLGFLPHLAELNRTPRNQHYFSIMTSGFTSVTNAFLRHALKNVLKLIDEGLIQMLVYPDFFSSGFRYKWDKDVYHYLVKVASGNLKDQERGLSHRIVRCMVAIYALDNREELIRKIHEILDQLDNCYDGEKNTPDIQRLKGMIREFEEELVWAHFGVELKNISHLRLGFYTGDIFTQQPERERDVQPVLDQLRRIQPTVISLAFDPEGSGPDTHYKVLQAIAAALREWSEEKDLSHIRIWGYRNVWYRFHPADADIICPVSLAELAVMGEAFINCYLSQKSASFPSYEMDGPFSHLSQKIWVDQLRILQLLLGKDYFYKNSHPRLRSAHGIILLKEMTVAQLLDQARELEKSVEGGF